MADTDPGDAGTDDAGRARPRTFWLTLIAIFAVAEALMTLAGLPSPFLFAGVVAAGVCSLAFAKPQRLPGPGKSFALGIIGVEAGSQVTPEVLHQVVAHPGIILGGTSATILITLAAGQILRLSPRVSGTTATLASISGGASGITAIADELNADSTIVVAVQYLRVLVIVLTVPLIAPLLGADRAALGQPVEIAFDPWEYAFTATALVAGLIAAAMLRFTASKVILPMVVAAILSIGGVFPAASVPFPVLAIGLALIGLTVGLELTREALRTIAKIMPLAVIQLVLGLVGSALVGVVLARATGLSLYAGYLATTPGGLPAVTAFAVSAGEGVGIIVTCHIVRLVLALFVGAIIGNVSQRRERRRSEGPGSEETTG